MSDDRRAILDRPPSRSPQPFQAVAEGKVTTNWLTILALVALVFAAGGIYHKMPSGSDITALDQKHTDAEKALQVKIDQHSEAISRMSGQVGFLVRIEVAKANADDDPGMRQALRQAAADAKTSAARPPRSTDPLAGIDIAPED